MDPKRPRAVLGFLAAAICSSGWGAAPAPAPPTCGQSSYRVVEVPMMPAAINDAGQVAGTTSRHRAAVWTMAGGLSELPLPAGFSHSEAVSINNRGQVAGVAFDAGFGRHQAFVVVDHTATLLPGDAARAHHISDAGTVAGESQIPGKTTTQPALWIHLRMLQPIATCCGGSVTSLYDLGQAIGVVYDDQGRYQAYRWTAAAGVQRIGPADRYSAAVAANNRGQIVIETFPGALLYRDGRWDRLRLAPKVPSHPHAINDCGVIVGSFGPYSDADRAFAWEESAGFQDLNALIPADSGWTLESASGINNRGEIVGKGDVEGKQDGGFLLVPLQARPEPPAG
jgi:uncharacterized membrane protein